MEIIDHRLVGSVHLDSFKKGADEDDGDAIFQTSTIEALLDGMYEGDLTVGEVLAHGDLGVGTVDHLDGELVVLDGQAFVVGADRRVRTVPASERTPFAVVCHHRPHTSAMIGPSDSFTELTDAIDGLAPEIGSMLAVRIDGRFRSLDVRSVSRQDPPYPPLRDVVAHQRAWTLRDQKGSLVGFRFPEAVGGVEVSGWHLHFLSDDRHSGGHVVDVELIAGVVSIGAADELHVELPASVMLPAEMGAGDRAAEIRAVEGR